MTNDRFKFRVWDKKEKRYVELAFFVSTEGILYVHYPLYMIAYSNPHTIEQCTGLKDKHGKLIYEGDIVRCVTGAVGGIIWDGSNGLMVNTEPFRTQLCETQEIVGNIHEVMA